MHSQARHCADNIVQRYCVQLEALETLPTLSLVRLVDKIVKILDTDAVAIYGLIRAGSDLFERLNSSDRDCAIDTEGKFVGNFEAAETLLIDWNKQYSLRRNDAVNDPKLKDRLEEEVIIAYDKVLEAQGELRSVLDTVKWYILEHDADLEHGGDIYTDAKSLIASLKR